MEANIATKAPFSNIQRELLRLFAQNIPEKQLLEIKELIARYLIEQAIADADTVWDSRGYTEATANEWARTHRGEIK
jgi:hypothetical protein